MKKIRETKQGLNFPKSDSETLKKLLLMTKCTVVIFFLSLMQVMAVDIYAQNARLSLSIEDERLEEVLGTIEKESEFFFLYNKDLIDVEQQVSVNAKNETIKSILVELLEGKDIGFSVYDRQIVLSNLDVINEMVAQQDGISGKIADSSGEPLPGVTVVLKGTTQGTVSNIDGNFSIPNVKAEDILVFSFVGMVTQEITVGSQTEINITMQPDAIGLEEIVAIGYGTQSKKKITSAISKVDMEGVRDMPVTSSGQILQGRASGVSVTDNNGTPGESPRITIHGLSSINAGTGPLIVIDGFPVGNSMPQSLNPNDIEQMTVLKDAASTSIYGARGSNGVILIETINADRSKMEIEYNVSEGFQYFPDDWRVPMLDAVQYAQYNKERVEELNWYGNKNNPVPQVYLDVLANPEAYKNLLTWQDHVFREGTNAMLHNHNLTIKAGNEKLRAVVSGGYQKQNGILPSTDFERFSFRTNIQSEITSWLKTTASISVARTESNSIPEEGSRGIFMKAVTTSPLQSPYDEDGKLRPYLPADSPGYFAGPNPLFEAYEKTNTSVGKDLNATFGFDLQIIEGLHYKPQVYARLYDQENNSFNPSTIGRFAIGNASNLAPGAPPFVNSASNLYRDLTNWGMDNLLTYNKTLGDHSVGALLGYTAQKQSGETAQISGTGFPTDDKINYLEAAETSASVADYSNWALNAAFVRLNYDYKAKYLIEVNFRREGSSKFGANNKYGNFPSTSLGWRVSEEDFFPKDFFMSELKLRASYGITGNSAIGDFDRFGRLVSIPNLNNVSDNYNYTLNNGVVVGKTLTSLGNQNLKWETSRQLDIGFNAGLFDDKVTVSAGYFQKTTEDMLFNVSIPNASGFGSTRDNVGEMENKGWDVEIGANLASNDFSWSGNLSLSFLENKVTYMPEEISKITARNNVTQVGYAVGSLYGYVIDGIYNTQEQLDDPNLYAWPNAKKLGAYIYRDVNEDGKIDGSDKDVLGNPHPKIQLGFNNVFNYKDFSLSILATGAFGYDILPQGNEVLYNEKGRWNVSTQFLERWTPDDPGAGLVPAIFYPGQHAASSLWIESGNHIWIKNVTLGYNVPKTILNKTKVIAGLRLYCSVQNALKITNYSGPNPQVSRNGSNPQQLGVDEFSYPVNRTVSFGANIKF